MTDSYHIALVYRDNANLRKSELVAQIAEKASFVHVFPFGTPDEEVSKAMSTLECSTYRKGWVTFSDLTCWQYVKGETRLLRQGDFDQLDAYIAENLSKMHGKKVVLVVDFLGCQFRQPEGGMDKFNPLVTAKWDKLALERWVAAFEKAGLSYKVVQTVRDEGFEYGDGVVVVADHHRISQHQFGSLEAETKFSGWCSSEGGAYVDSCEGVFMADKREVSYYLERAVKV